MHAQQGIQSSCRKQELPRTPNALIFPSHRFKQVFIIQLILIKTAEKAHYLLIKFVFTNWFSKSCQAFFFPSSMPAAGFVGKRLMHNNSPNIHSLQRFRLCQYRLVLMFGWILNLRLVYTQPTYGIGSPFMQRVPKPGLFNKLSTTWDTSIFPGPSLL